MNHSFGSEGEKKLLNLQFEYYGMEINISRKKKSNDNEKKHNWIISCVRQ